MPSACVLERPVLTVRLGDDDRPKPTKPKSRKRGKGAERRSRAATCKLRDVRIEDGTVNIVYDDKGTEKRIEHIAANLSLPTLAEPLTGTGKFDWKEQTVDFSFELTSRRRSPREAPGEARACARYAGHRRALRRQRR